MFLSKSRMMICLLVITSIFIIVNAQEIDNADALKKCDMNSEWVTVYVHGTITKTGIKFINKFCPEVCYGAPGIHHINNMPEYALFRQDVDKLCNGDSNRFSKQHFYTFGWSGALSFSEREKSGKHLYENIKLLLKEYKEKYGFYPKIRVMTFSHGGNVALNMTSHLPFFKDEHIHLELLLIASPVQKVTESLIQNEEIDFIYTIASTRDLLQVIDNYKFNNKRYFPERFFNTNQKNCCQMKVFVNERGLGHVDLLRSFMIHVPYCLNTADAYFSKQKSTNSNKNLEKVKNSEVIEVKIDDDKFCFYKGYNLIPCIYGKRKK